MNKTLGKMREWIQRTAINGSLVPWGSNEVLRFTKDLSVVDFECLAIELAESETRPVNEIQERLDDYIKKADKIKGFIKNPPEDEMGVVDVEDLKGELENVNCDIRLLKWVLGE